MHEQVGAVNANGQDATESAAGEGGDPGSRDRTNRPAAGFVYPGGSRPLDGYTIKRGIGHGGFGEIYYALSDAGKEVALKLIRRNLDIELRGIRHCLNLKHPNLLALYDIRQDAEGDTWVVMEYVSGGCLSDAVAARPRGMPPEEAMGWFRGIAAGVAHLHDRGIVHRDLKPGNIFCEEGLVKVGDYGLSKFISCSRRSGQTESVGTVHYMAPEVANGRYGKEIDIYAMGVILYEMLTGRVPFEGESIGEVLMKHLTAQPDVSMLAEPYRGIVARALEKDPAKRYSSVPAMVAALPASTGMPPGADRLPSGSYGPAVGVGGVGNAGPTIEAQVVDEEPILKAVSENWTRLRTAWDQADLAAPIKVIILLAVIFALVVSAQFVIPLAILLAAAYGVYRIVRSVAMSSDKERGPAGHAGPAPRPSPSPSPPPPTAQPAAPRHGPVHARTRPGWHPRPHRREEAAAALVVKSAGERLTELVGSLLGGALVAVAMCVVMVLLNTLVIEEGGWNTRYQEYALYGWLLLSSIAGTWSVLVPAKFWEGTRGEAVLRRFTMMLVGLVLGALVYGAGMMLGVDSRLFWFDGHQQELAMPVFFGTLFLVIRWWRQADPLRATRLSLWTMFVSVAVAAVIANICNFPHLSWVVMIAGVISASVQLASPWMHPHERRRRKGVVGSG